MTDGSNWRPEWQRRRNGAEFDEQEYLERLRDSRAKKKAARLKLIEEEVAQSRALPTTGAKWLEHPATGDVRRGIFERLCNMDAGLVVHGHHPLSDPWREALNRWLVESQAMTLVVRKGRRIGASTIIAPRLIVAWVLEVVPRLQLPPGEIILVGLVSVRRGEAANRIAQISAVLTELEIPHIPKADEIELVGAPAKITVLTRNWKTAVGENVGLLWCDEVSRWESEESSANPAAEVVASLKPTLATMRVQGYALMCLVSSPWSTDDYHAQQFDLGDTADQSVAFIPTWIGNPTITEEQTHGLEADERIWKREYAAIPGNVLSQALDADDVGAAFGMVVAGDAIRHWCCIDASSLRGDAFTAAFGYEARGGFMLTEFVAWEDAALRNLVLDEVVTVIVSKCKELDIATVWGDQREAAGLNSLFLSMGLTFRDYAWTLQSKHSAFLALRRLLHDRRMGLAQHSTLRSEMLRCKSRLIPSGLQTYETNGLDYLSAIITLMHAYQVNYPDALSRILAGGTLEAPKSREELAADDQQRKIAQYRRDAEKRARQYGRRWG